MTFEKKSQTLKIWSSSDSMHCQTKKNRYNNATFFWMKQCTNCLLNKICLKLGNFNYNFFLGPLKWKKSICEEFIPSSPTNESVTTFKTSMKWLYFPFALRIQIHSFINKITYSTNNSRFLGHHCIHLSSSTSILTRHKNRNESAWITRCTWTNNHELDDACHSICSFLLLSLLFHFVVETETKKEQREKKQSSVTLQYDELNVLFVIAVGYNLIWMGRYSVNSVKTKQLERKKNKKLNNYCDQVFHYMGREEKNCIQFSCFSVYRSLSVSASASPSVSIARLILCPYICENGPWIHVCNIKAVNKPWINNHNNISTDERLFHLLYEPYRRCKIAHSLHLPKTGCLAIEMYNNTFFSPYCYCNNCINIRWKCVIFVTRLCRCALTSRSEW